MVAVPVPGSAYHEPPPVGLASVTLAFSHTADGPVIAERLGLTVTVVVVVHPAEDW